MSSDLVTTSYLIAAGIAPTQAKQFAQPLAVAAAEFNINTPRRLAAFVGQCAHESSAFTRLEESLYYTTPERIRQMWPSRVRTLADAKSLTRSPQALANRVYASKGGNGNESSGDGWRYRGRGLIQLTLQGNYAAAEKGTGRPYLAQPELVSTPADAALSSAWWWAANGCNALADAWDISALTRRVNGPAKAGLADRLARSTIALDAFDGAVA